MANIHYPDKDRPFPLAGLGAVLRVKDNGRKQVFSLRPGAWADVLDHNRVKTGYTQNYRGVFEVGENTLAAVSLTLNVVGAEFEAEIPTPAATGLVEAFSPDKAEILIRSTLPDGSVMGQPLTAQDNGKLNGILSLPYALTDAANRACGLGFTDGVSVTVSRARMVIGKRKASVAAVTGLSGTEFDTEPATPEAAL